MDHTEAVIQEFERIDLKRSRKEPLTDQEYRFVTVNDFIGMWDHGGIDGPLLHTNHDDYTIVLNVLDNLELSEMVNVVTAVKEHYYGPGRIPDDFDDRCNCFSSSPDREIDDAFSLDAFNRAMVKLISV